MTAPNVEKLVKIAGLLGSEHPGERAAAALKLTEAMKAESLTMADVFANLRPAPMMFRHVWSEPWISLWRRNAKRVLCSSVRLNDRERTFLHGMAARREEPTPLQAHWLDDLVARLGGAK